MELALFAIFGALAVVGALVVIVAPDPFFSALALLINFAGLGALYLVLHAPFVAMAQVIVYAGAVVVLFLFVIAYLGDRRELLTSGSRAQWARPLSGLVGGGILCVIAAVLWHDRDAASLAAFRDVPDAFGSAERIGELFLTKFVLQFEATSLVLMVAAIGGVVLGLTGRERHRRMRRLMHSSSADQHKRATRLGLPAQTPAGRPHAPMPPAGADADPAGGAVH